MEEPELSTDVLEIALSLVYSPARESRPPVDDLLLTRFAAGLVTPEEHEQVIDSMTRSDELRGRFLRLRQELSRGTDIVGSLVERVLTSYQSMVHRIVDLSDPFTLAALRAAGQQISAGLSGARWATVRSGVGTAVEPWSMTVWPSGIAAKVTATLSEEGALSVVARTDVELAQLELCLRDPAFGCIVLGRAARQAGVFEFLMPRFAEVTGIDRIDPSIFLLSESGSESKIEDGTIVADTPFGSPVSIRLVSAPKVSAGVLQLSVSLPLEVRRRMADYEIELLLVVGSMSVHLSAAGVSDLEEGIVRFQAEVGHVPDGAIATGSIFRLRFKPIG